MSDGYSVRVAHETARKPDRTINKSTVSCITVSRQDGDTDVVSLLGDETVRSILLEMRDEPMSVSTLTERCEASRSTIYRRLEDLKQKDLVAEHTQPDEEGHHHRVYVAVVDEVTVSLTEEGYRIDIDRSDDTEVSMVDRFTRAIEDM